jgi:hypothetical protein
MSQYDELMESAKSLLNILNNMKLSDPLMDEAYHILHPIIEQVILKKGSLPARLPNRDFFFGMHEDSLPAHYLDHVTLMNAIGEFDKALKKARGLDCG